MTTWMLFLILGVSNLMHCTAMVYHINPSLNSSCPGEHCLTLSQFVANVKFIESNTTMIFLPGNHTLDTRLTAYNVTSFIMFCNQSFEDMASSVYNTRITCKMGANFVFSTIQYLKISGIELIECGGNRVQLVKNFTLEHSIFFGKRANRTAMEFVQTNARIVSTTFLSNRNVFIHSESEFWPYTRKQHSAVGGAMIVINSNITISNSKFQ